MPSATNTPQSSIKVGGVPLLFKPNLSSNPIVAGVQQFGTGVAKGAAETIRQTGQLGTLVQKGINKVAGTSLPITTAYDEGGTLEQSTTPEGGLQKAGYGVETAMEFLVPPSARVVKGTAQVAGAGTKVASSIATGVPREVLTRAASPEYAPKIERAIADIAETPNQPFLALAQRTGSNLAQRSKEVSDNIVKSVDEFNRFQPNTRFDVSPKVPEIVKSLDKFKSSGLSLESKSATSLSGKTTETAKIVRSKQSPFTDKEVGLLNGLVDSMKQSTDVDVNNLLALRKKIAAAYDAVPLGVNGDPTPYHAAVMTLKESTEKAIDELLPKQLKDANAQYRKFEELKSAFGNKLIDSQGNLKDGAEQFLANLGNLNKGELRAKVEAYKEVTGVDLLDEIQTLKDAQKLSPLFATTGSRTQDILRALAVGGVGAGGGGAIGSAIGLAATSPRLAGKVATSVGKAKGFINQLLGASK
jgi:hypothetical protein